MTKVDINKVLIANRGEIAVRIIDALRSLGKKAVVIYSEADASLPFVAKADEAWPIGSGTLTETYLDQNKIIDIARKSGSDAIHPGYGFLSENADFAELCHKNKIAFIGPDPGVINLMGNKVNARETAKKYGVPIIEGITGNADEILKEAASLTYPLLIKPSAGGGGKGMKIVASAGELKEALQDASREALNYFGSNELYIERYIEKARHIEVQVLADKHGNAVHLFERECTLQRRYQKIIEEAPASSLREDTRENIRASALLLTSGIRYSNAGTIEFLVDENEEYFFIEMNTRIQVEHPVTELITGVDIVAEQIRIAEGLPLQIKQEDLKITGHAVEARLYAEVPEQDFIPSSGPIRKLDTGTSDCRIDIGYREGNHISTFYDPMIAKIIAHGKDRSQAIGKLVNGLKEIHIAGIKTNREFLISLLQSRDIEQNTVHTKYIDQELKTLLETGHRIRQDIDPFLLLSIGVLASLNHTYIKTQGNTVWNEIGYWRHLPKMKLLLYGENYGLKYKHLKSGTHYLIEYEERTAEIIVLEKSGNFYKLLFEGKQVKCWVDISQSEILIDLKGHTFLVRRMDIPDTRYLGKSSTDANSFNGKDIPAPLNGKVVKIDVRKNDKVKSGDSLLIIESMKMENRIVSPVDGEIEKINVTIGELVEPGKVLLTYK